MNLVDPSDWDETGEAELVSFVRIPNRAQRRAAASSREGYGVIRYGRKPIKRAPKRRWRK